MPGTRVGTVLLRPSNVLGPTTCAPSLRLEDPTPVPSGPATAGSKLPRLAACVQRTSNGHRRRRHHGSPGGGRSGGGAEADQPGVGRSEPAGGEVEAGQARLEVDVEPLAAGVT